ncbi:MAG: sugar-binding protein, partial [Bacteroides sp.]|nr:sugar-binding protein [Bacteroides sp.]
MKRIFTLMISAMFVAGVFAQRPEGVIMKASVSPVIDAEVDAVWAEANVYPIDKAFRTEVPTVDGTTWKMLWDEFGIYVLVECLDDQWWPTYLGDGGADYLFDKPEVYFDVNLTLEDGGGASAANGHYQVAPGPTEGQTDGTVLMTDFQGGAAQATYSITVLESGTDVNYEYFIPFDALSNGDGIDITGEVGFDVTMIDRDEGDADRKRAVWANIGDQDESWSNMDDVGYITFDGAEIGVYVESVSIEDAVIDENNGMVQIMATVLPENADIKSLKWTVENGTGKASIDNDGVITGIMDGTVTVNAIAKDGSYIEDNCTVTISNQIVSLGEINLFRNGNFDDVDVNGSPLQWDGGFSVIDGALYIPAPEVSANWWEGNARSNQTGFGLNTTDEYTFSFVMWSESPDTFYIDFEDPSNGYNRFGDTNSPLASGLSDGSADGASQWEF